MSSFIFVVVCKARYKAALFVMDGDEDDVMVNEAVRVFN